MWPFRSKKPKSVLDLPRYKSSPIDLFFELYILDTIGHMPPDKSPEEFDLQNIFQTQASDWKGALAETLHFSDTIDIAILDLWYRNRKHYDDPRHFAQDFVDQYMKDDSRVDVWPEGALDAAKARIAKAHQEENV